jgi:hypothetical protein
MDGTQSKRYNSVSGRQKLSEKESPNERAASGRFNTDAALIILKPPLSHLAPSTRPLYHSALMRSLYNRTAIRNEKIVQLHTDGQSLAKISLQIGISRSRAGHILQGTKRRELFIKRGGKLQKTIREANDLTLRIPLDDLFVALQFPINMRIGKHLKEHFGICCVQELSLTEFMDFLIPNFVTFRGLYHTIPAYRARKIGSITYANILKEINKVESDLGEAFREEWTRRKKRLRDCLIANNYSAPYLMKGKDPAI